MTDVGVLPVACQPESARAALAELEVARQRIDETGQQLADAHRASQKPKDERTRCSSAKGA